MKRNSTILYLLALPLAAWLVAACSTTSALPEGEQLYTGLKSTQYENYEANDHFNTTKAEVDVVLAAAPNGALFGSSSVRSPFPVGLWIWNAFSNSKSSFGKWMTKAFAKKPVLLSNVNPLLRSTVGDNTLSKRGYFDGKVSYKTFPYADNKKAKVQYTVNLGHLWTVDTLAYVGFPADADSLLDYTREQSYVKRDDPFDVARLENERQRISELFRDNGYYYYDKNHASYLADTVNVPGKVQLRLQMAEGLRDSIMHKYYIGNITINYKKNFMEKLEQSRKMRTLTINYNGDRPPIRSRVVLNDLQVRSRQLYSRQRLEESQRKINASGVFSTTMFRLTPRKSPTALLQQAGDSMVAVRTGTDTLDLTIDCILDKPYDFYVEAYGKGKSSGKFGPELIVGFTKRNALRGGELLDVSLHGSYEWQTGHRGEGTKTRVNSYRYGAEASLTFPRIVNPFQTPMRKKLDRMRKRGESLRDPDVRKRIFRRRYYDTPSTVLKASADVINRAEFFKQHVVSGELRYNWKTSANSSYEFTPLSITYEYMSNRTDSFIRLQEKHPYLKTSMADQFIPKMSFSYSYHSPDNYRNPISWWTTVSEASNLLAAGYAVFGQKWSEKDKTMFKNPFAQFVKLETNFTKTWRLGDYSSLAAHANIGVVWAYGNSAVVPYNEQFYGGGANSIRAFNTRGIGPGKYRPANNRSSYVEQTGDIKVLMNLEYRPKLFGKMYGAVFLDVGNVWAMREDANRAGAKFEMKNFFKQMAVGTGIGLRYDFDFFILRLDWGVGLHVPYDTGKSGFYNIGKFADAQAFHLAIGLPF